MNIKKNTPKNQTLNDPIIFKEQKEVILRMIKIEERINLNVLAYDLIQLYKIKQ